MVKFVRMLPVIASLAAFAPLAHAHQVNAADCNGTLSHQQVNAAQQNNNSGEAEAGR